MLLSRQNLLEYFMCQRRKVEETFWRKVASSPPFKHYET